MNRRGYTMSLVMFLEVTVVITIIIVATIIGLRFFSLFDGDDKRAENTFEQMAAWLDSLAEKEGSYRALFPFVKRSEFTGSVFGIAGESLTDPFPPFDRADRAALDDAKAAIDVEALQASHCDAPTCLCFSKEVLAADAEAKDVRKLYLNPERCESYDIELEIDMQPYETALDGETYELVMERQGQAVAISLEALTS